MILTLPAADGPLPVELLATLVDVIDRAYRENAPLQDASLGHNNWNYALDIVTSVKHFLRELDLEAVVVDGQTLRLEVHGRRFYIHKLGRSERDDPWTSFPAHAGPAGRAAEASQNQLRLEFEEFAEAGPAIWVVGHYGCLEEGLRAIRLQGSGAADAGKITSWTAVLDAFVAADQAAPAATVESPAASGPPAIDVEEPPLLPKRPAAPNEANASD